VARPAQRAEAAFRRSVRAPSGRPAVGCRWLRPRVSPREENSEGPHRGTSLLGRTRRRVRGRRSMRRPSDTAVARWAKQRKAHAVKRRIIPTGGTGKKRRHHGVERDPAGLKDRPQPAGLNEEERHAVEERTHPSGASRRPPWRATVSPRVPAASRRGRRPRWVARCGRPRSAGTRSRARRTRAAP
jgi:hypothetical protein